MSRCPRCQNGQVLPQGYWTPAHAEVEPVCLQCGWSGEPPTPLPVPSAEEVRGNRIRDAKWGRRWA
jgi:hypothetical protein